MSGVARMSTRARALLFAQDALLVIAFTILARNASSNGFAIALCIGIVTVLAWSYATLHFPHRVTWSDDSIAFAAYGREHAFRWDDVTHVHVRRFLVKDRVLVRLLPAPSWRGRYWLLARMEGYDALVAELDRRCACTPARPAAIGATLRRSR